MDLRVQSDPMEEKQFHRSGICDDMVMRGRQAGPVDRHYCRDWVSMRCCAGVEAQMHSDLSFKYR